MEIEEQIKIEESKENPNIALLQKLYRKLGEQRSQEPKLCKIEDPSCESCQ